MSHLPNFEEALLCALVRQLQNLLSPTFKNLFFQ
jgi:hypothetical protein